MGILGIALPLLGIGGIGAALVFIPGLLPAVIAFAKTIPTKVWIAIAAVALLVAGYFIHQHKAHAAIAAAYAKGSSDRDAAWQKRLDAEHAAAVKWQRQAEAAQLTISNETGAKHEQALRDIASRADDQRLHGPGRAAAPSCGHVGSASLPAPASGGHAAPGGASDAAVAGLSPDEGLAIVRWDDLTSFAASHDAERAENLIWREWYARQAEANRVAREAGPKPVK